MPRPISSATASSGSATALRRGAHSSRGWPIKVNITGANTSTPSVSPTHHAAQCCGACAMSSRPDSPSAPSPTLALMQLATAASQKKRHNCGGSANNNGWPTKRLASAAPAQACNATPTPIAAVMAASSTLGGPALATKPRLAAIEPSATPTSAQRPQTNAVIKARPAAGQNGEARPGGIASNRPSRAQTR